MFCLFLGKEKDWGPIITLLIMTLSIVARDFLSFRLQCCKRGGFFSPERKLGGGGLSSCWFMLAVGCVCKIPVIEEVDMGPPVYSGKFKGNIKIVRFLYH